MDAFKQLKMELNFIETTLQSYSDNSSAVAILTPLKNAMKEKDKEGILYCLGVIEEWYRKSFAEIMRNGFAYNLSEHRRAFELVEELRNKMESYQFPSDNMFFTQGEIAVKLQISKNPIIFISHRSSDQEYGDAIVKFLRALGVPNNQIIYTSHPLHKIPLDANIYDFLRENIGENVFMVILWSNEYLESPACLNEMGAGWVVQCDYTNMYVPSFSFNNNPKYHECAVDTKKMGAVLNGDAHCKQNMIEFKNKVINMFGLQESESTIAYCLDVFMDDLKKLQGGTNEENETGNA